MKTFLLLAVLAALAPLAQAGDARVAQVPADLILAETSGANRVLVFRVCSPEHCWNEFFIQELSGDDAVICTAPVAELNGSSDVVVRSSHWGAGSLSALELDLISSHGAFKPYLASLSLHPGCKYQLRPTAPQAANSSFKPNWLRQSA